jgi:hypothetical protein
MTPSEEDAYELGRRAACVRLLADLLRQLGYDLADPEIHRAALIREREETIAQLRDVCEEYGDNEWSEELHLGDVVEKHLYRHLQQQEAQQANAPAPEGEV